MEFLRNLFRCVNDPRFRLLTFPERPWLPEYYDLVDERCRAKQLADGVPLEPGAGPWWHDAYWEIYYEVYQPTLTVADYLGNLLFVLGSLSVFVLVAASVGSGRGHVSRARCPGDPPISSFLAAAVQIEPNFLGSYFLQQALLPTAPKPRASGIAPTGPDG